MKLYHKIQETFQSLKRNFSQGIFIYDSSLAKSQDGDYVIHSPNPVWQSFRKGLMMGFGIMLGMFGTGVMAVAVTGTIKTWTANEKLTASDLNTTIASLKTAIESITSSQWTTSGSNISYSAGNVSIGTSDNSWAASGNVNRLSLDSSSWTTLNLRSTNVAQGSQILGWNGTTQIGTLFFGGSSYPNLGGANSVSLGTYQAAPLSLFTNSVDRLRIIGNGNVGIGTTSPNRTLTITSGSDDARVSIFSVQSIGVIEAVANTNTSVARWMSLNPNGGNVGIGTLTSSYTLHVNGSVAGTSAYNNLSDGRYKENIQPISGALDKIEKLRGVTYTWKNKEFKDLKFKEGQDLGFIGQEVEKVIPEAISKDEKGIISLAYSNLIPVLVEAMKELRKNQEARNEDLLLRLRLVTESFSKLTESNLELNDKLGKVKEENEALKKQLSELKKENSDFKMTFLEELKQIKDLRYAKK